MPEDGHLFTFDIPYDAFLLERNKDGKPTPEAEAETGAASGWIEVDGQFIGLTLKNSEPRLTSYISTPSTYAQLQRLWDRYRSGNTEVPLSPSQKKAIEKQAVQHSKQQFFSFMTSRKVKLFWDAPDGQNHLIGQFGRLRHKIWEADDYSAPVSTEAP